MRVHFGKYLSRIKPEKLVKNIFISTSYSQLGGATLIDTADNRKDLRKWETFWQYKISTFFTRGSNERNVPADYE